MVEIGLSIGEEMKITVQETPSGIVPIDENARKFAMLLNRPTFPDAALALIRELGFEVEVLAMEGK